MGKNATRGDYKSRGDAPTSPKHQPSNAQAWNRIIIHRYIQTSIRH